MRNKPVHDIFLCSAQEFEDGSTLQPARREPPARSLKRWAGHSWYTHVSTVMWSPSSSRRGGKTTMLQPFPQQHVERWKAYAKQLPQGSLWCSLAEWGLQLLLVLGLLVDVWDGRTAHAQLASLKKVTQSLAKTVSTNQVQHYILLLSTSLYYFMWCESKGQSLFRVCVIWLLHTWKTR